MFSTFPPFSLSTILPFRLFALGGCLFVLTVLPVPVSAGEPPSPVPDVGIDQHLNGQVPGNLIFRDETGRSIQLGDYWGTTPVILVFAYYQCPMLCPLVLDGVVKSLRVLSFDAGKEFAVVIVSFAPAETPALAAAKKEQIVRQYARPGTTAGWHFLTGDETAITRLTQAVGFRYAYDKTHGQYAHAAGIVVLTPQGRIARYLYGIEFAPRDLRLGLVEAAANKIGALADQLLLLCYHYDPATGKYTALTIGAVRIGGAVTVLALGVFIVIAGRRDRMKKGGLRVKNGDTKTSRSSNA
ncbi:MAG TPA: SCO family protein [Candidatus Binatia bacterium]|jgi:protein SCO1/2|nr:SCO family protein [Candidatus Binatia bacterium]